MRDAGPACCRPHILERKSAMTAQALPDNPNYCFVPAWDGEDEVQQIRIVMEGMAGYVPTALIALTVQDAENMRDKLNRRLGLDRNAWTAMAAASMCAEVPEPGDPASHRGRAEIRGRWYVRATEHLTIGSLNGDLLANQGMGQGIPGLDSSTRLLDCPLQGAGGAQPSPSREPRSGRPRRGVSPPQAGRNHRSLSALRNA